MRSPRIRAAVAAVVLVVLAGLTGCGSSGGGQASSGGSSASGTSTLPPPGVTVMTRNLYLGADLQPLFSATAETLGSALQATYQQVVDSEVEARLDLVAKEIAGAHPDLVALQEASLWQVQPAGASAPTVLYDYLTTLLARLDAAGAGYTVAVTADGFNGGLPVPGVGAVTMQDRDVILLRTGSKVSVANPTTGRFTNKLTVSVLGTPIDVLRGWASVDATVDGRTFRLYATHLEAFDDPTRDAQEAELLATMGSSTLPTMLLGDLNSAASGTGSEAYDHAIAAGFADAWKAVHPDDPGLSCCRTADLKGGTLTQRIDFVLARGGFDATAASLVGGDDSPHTAGGRWPSDHAGVVATFALGGLAGSSG